jgi:hypothetical protein
MKASITAAWRAEEEHASGGLLAVLEENLRVLERPLDHLDKLLLDIL